MNRGGKQEPGEGKNLRCSPTGNLNGGELLGKVERGNIASEIVYFLCGTL